MATYGGSNVVTDGLVLALDAANPKSYPGSGTTWKDLSQGQRHYSIGATTVWNSAGYFQCFGNPFTGPASNTFEFTSDNEHTVEAFAKSNGVSQNEFFNFQASPNIGTDPRAIFSHLYYNNGSTYYDVSGCCATTQRISYPNDSDLTAGVRHLAWRTRKSTTPNRQFFKNLISQMDSGANSTATVTWNLTTAATIANSWTGNLYMIRVYNRALSDTEITQNYNAQKSRFNL